MPHEISRMDSKKDGRMDSKMDDKNGKMDRHARRGGDGAPTVSPSIDVYENADEILLLADMPGVSSDDLDVNLDKGELLVQATRGADAGGKLIEVEYGPCVFQRRFVLPAGIDVARVTANLTNGVLHLHLPKSDAFKPRKIDVRAG
jgi:HSP20 family protein